MEYTLEAIEEATNNILHVKQSVTLRNLSKELSVETTISNETFKNITTDHEGLLLSPDVASVFLSLDILIGAIGVFLHYLIRKMVNREETKEPILLGNVLRAYTWTYLFLTLFITINVHGILAFLYPVVDIIGPWYCFVVEFLSHSLSSYFACHSVLVATMKYYCIVHREKVDGIGRERVKKIFLVTYLVGVGVIATLNSLSNGAYDQRYWVNMCWGRNNVASSLDYGFWHSIKGTFCYNREYELVPYIGQQASNFFEPILRVMCGGVTIFYIIFATNVLELFIYYSLFKYLDR